MAEATIFKTADKAATESKTARTADGFENFVARLGTGYRSDNVLSAGTYTFDLITRNRIKLEAAYRGSWIVGQVVDAVAEDMTRAGITLTTSEQAERIDEVKTAFSRMQIWQSIADTVKWSRLYGGALAVLQIKGQDPATPLDPETISQGQFLGLSVYDRWQLNPDLTRVIQSGPNLGLPEFYNIVLGGTQAIPASTPTGQITVHHSRCIRLIGIQLPFYQAITEMMWGESILERLWDRLIAFDSASLSAGNLINRAQLRTVGIDGLREILASGGPAQQALIEQFELMRQLQTNEGLTLLDKEDTFTSTAYSFAGLSDMMLQFAQQLSGACGIPLVRLFNQSPAGLNATGDADIRMYYDNINAQQESRLRNGMEMVLEVMWRSLFGDSMPDDLQFTFTPLWQMSATEKAAIAKSNAETLTGVYSVGGIDRATMMKELRQHSAETGLFGNITDEQIEDAEDDEPPVPGNEPGEISVGAESDESKEQPDNASPPKNKAGDSAWRKIAQFIRGQT